MEKGDKKINKNPKVQFPCIYCSKFLIKDGCDMKNCQKLKEWLKTQKPNLPFCEVCKRFHVKGYCIEELRQR